MCSSRCRYWCLWFSSGVSLCYTLTTVYSCPPSGPPALRPEAWLWLMCVCVSCTTSDTHRLQCCYHVFRVRPVCYLKRILQTLASSSAHVTCPRKAVLTLTPGTTHQRALEADFEQCPTHTLMISRCHQKAFFRYNFQMSEILPGLFGGSCKHS